ncbi:multidrug effflux MFS transporter [Qingshengfaniella alkalisoli]|uniref:Bcr/CflA family efflux transporter n=1 Tax=Qingshengfaniella alkalisoli TaxID=2599296 RepID=A0A5B8I7L9_9RHOB|nr:multidrug effflux MFS transporter [Qingshengfaniella alkalisoli]QDY69579.1 multidrug effflux MFS transporter [Qingshengfaniella alkalisoli]
MTTSARARFLDRSTPPNIVTLVLLAGVPAAAMNVYLPSLPTMTEHFQTEYRLMQLSVALYLAVNAVLQIFIGPISDRFGRRPVILWSFGLFMLATLGTIYAPTAESFLLFRMAQAIVVSGMVLSRAIVRDMYDADQSASMIGYVTMGMAVVPMFSPAIGGLMDEMFGWQANFWLLFVLAGGVVVISWFDLGETAPKANGSLKEQMREAPELFRSLRFWGYNLTIMTASGTFFAYLGGAPFVGSEVFTLTPAKLGYFFGAPAVGYLVGNALAGRYSVRYGINAMALCGTLLTAFGLTMALIVFYSGLGSVWTFFGFMVFVGLGNGMVLPNATAGMLSVRPRLAGTAAGLGGALMIGGGAALSAFAGAMLTPGSGAYPLLWIMVCSATLSVLSILFVILRERKITP